MVSMINWAESTKCSGEVWQPPKLTTCYRVINNEATKHHQNLSSDDAFDGKNNTAKKQALKMANVNRSSILMGNPNID